MRLIDADKLEPTELYVGNGEFAMAVFMDDIDDMPTVEAEPIVRCKECKYNTLGGEKGNALCELEMPLFQNYDYCSRGEKR